MRQMLAVELMISLDYSPLPQFGRLMASRDVSERWPTTAAWRHILPVT